MPEPTPEEIEAQRIADEAKTAADEAAAKEAALGEPGKRAIAAERAERQKAEKAAKALQARLDAIEAENATEQDKAIKAARDEGKAEATTAANKIIIKSEVRAAATGKFVDPADAVAFLDLDQFDVGDDGTVDAAAVTAALDALLLLKPHLAAGEQKPPPAGNPDGGARPPVTAKTLDEAIREAEQKGDWQESLRLKSVKATNKS